MSAPRVEVHDTSETLATAVAGELLARLEDAQSAGHEPQIALTGGTIAEAVHSEVARLSAASEVDWSRVVVWWGDERFVAPDSPDRNAGEARAAFLSSLGVDPAKIHEMPSTADAPDVDAGAVAYSDAVRMFGSGEFDVTMLGVGPDGHIASLFPGFPQLDVADLVAVPVTDSPKPPPERISLTFAALNRSKSVWFLVSGTDKAAVLPSVLRGDFEPQQLPAQLIRPESGNLLWLVDRAAAARLGEPRDVAR